MFKIVVVGLTLSLLASEVGAQQFPPVARAKINKNALRGLGDNTCEPGSRKLQPSRGLQASAIISNGVIKLGINSEGNLNVPGDTPSIVERTTAVGLRFLVSEGEYESTAHGCACEGWGASAEDVSTNISFSGYANVANGGANLDVVSFTFNSTTAASVVDVVDVTSNRPLRVTHEFNPMPENPNLYEVNVTYENRGASSLTDLRYRRVMDWDIEPNIFSECVDLDGGSAVALEYASDNGFASSNPLTDAGSILFQCPSGDSPCPVVGSGPADHGAIFQFLFLEDDLVTPKTLSPNETLSFTVYYGAAADKAAALNVFDSAKIEVYSLGFPSTSNSTCSGDGSPGTFFFGFRGVGGKPITENRPPSAICRDAIKDASSACDAFISADDVDNGSEDPDGDAITRTLDITGPFYPGASHQVTLTVSDGSETSSCTAKVTVVDKELPVAVCVPYNPTGKGSSRASGKGSREPNDIWLVSGSDNCANATLQIRDKKSGYVYKGPFNLSKTTVRYVKSPGAKNKQKRGSGRVNWKLVGKGPMEVLVTDGAGSTKSITCPGT